MKLGLVTYNLARGWDIETIIARCESSGFEAVEFRTTHAHGVEVSLDGAQRAAVRRRFEDSGVRQLSLGSTCEYDSVDPDVVRANVELTNKIVDLAVDIGAAGVKVRPNALHEDEGIPTEKTLEQIGTALRECGKHAEDTLVSIWLEVHGRETQHPPHIRRIMEAADHPKVGVCWNSNMDDVVDGSVAEYFELLRPWLMSVHINNLWNREYPYRELFGLLKDAGYEGYCLAEIAEESAEPDTFMRYYAALFGELQRD
jgi:sugar phosphate isomerase/epimerase